MPGWNLGTRCFKTWRLIIREGKARARAFRERWRVGSLLSLLRKLSSKFAFIAFAQYGACWMNADWSLTTGPLDCARTYKDEWNLGTRWLTTWRLSKARARALQERWRVGSLFFFRLAIIIYLQPWKKGRKLTVLKTRRKRNFRDRILFVSVLCWYRSRSTTNWTSAVLWTTRLLQKVSNLYDWCLFGKISSS